MIKKVDLPEGRTKSEKVYQFLKQKILASEYKPGERIVIREVARQLSVSDIPVREAIKKLASDGLLELKSHSGARVATLNIENLEEIFLIRLNLETLATRLAANSATKEEIALLESLVHKMDQSIQKGDIPGYTDYNREFHNQLYRSSHSPVLIEIIESLYMRSENSKMTFHHNPDRLQASNDEHRAIVVALQDRNAEEAAEILRVQKEQGFQIVLNALKVSRLFMGEID